MNLEHHQAGKLDQTPFAVLSENLGRLVSAWIEVGKALSVVPPPTSPAGADAAQFALFEPDGPKNVGYAPGQLAGLYVEAVSQHLLALKALLDGQALTVGPWPLVRAELELAGRVSWLLSPDLGPTSGQRRVARFYLEAISSHQRERFTAGKHDKAVAKRAKGDRDAKIAEAKSVFGTFAPDLSSMDKFDIWELHGEKMPGLGAGASHFVNTCLATGVGLYDFLSDYSHPSITAIVRQTTEIDTEGITQRPWVTVLEVVEEQARIACLIFYKACHLLVSYYALDESPLDRWADSVPEAWWDPLAREAGPA